MKYWNILFMLFLNLPVFSQDIISSPFITSGIVVLGQNGQVQLNINQETLSDTYTIDYEVNHVGKIINVNVTYNYIQSGIESPAIFTEFPSGQMKLTGTYSVFLNLNVPFNPTWNSTLGLGAITVIDPPFLSCDNPGIPFLDGLCPNPFNSVCGCDGMNYQNECFAYLEARIGNYINQGCWEYMEGSSLEFFCDNYTTTNANFFEIYGCLGSGFSGDELFLNYFLESDSLEDLQFSASDSDVVLFLTDLANGPTFCYRYSENNRLDLSGLVAGHYLLIADKVSPGPFSIEFCTATSLEERIQESIKLFPNPASDYLEVRNLGHGTKRIQIIDVNGILYKTLTTESDAITFDTSDLSGLYFIDISGENGEHKLMKIIISN